MLPMTEVAIVPVPKPRMTRSDAWRKRRCVVRYWEFKDELLIKLGRDFVMPECDYHIIFYLPMPKSWSRKKRLEMDGKPHQQKPDKDNLEKAFLDCVLADDSKIWDGRATKRWAQVGKITLKKLK